MIIDYITNHQAGFWLVLGFILLIIEVITGFAAGAFLFAGLGALTTGLLMTFGLLPETWLVGVSVTGISTGIITLLLWKPLKKLQGDRHIAKDDSSDLIGYEFIAESDITPLTPGTIQYSGITWKVVLDKHAGTERISAGQRVIVTSVDVAMFKVKPAI